MKKKILYIFLVFLLVLTYQKTFAAEPKTFKVGAFNNYPVIFMDTDGVFKGLYVDLLTEIGNKENIKFEYVLGTWNDGLDRIKSSEVDLLTSVGYTEERSLFMDYTNNSILTVWGEVYVPQSSKISSILDLSQKKIGVLSGDINAKNFFELMSKFNISYQSVEFGNYDDVFNAVEKKQVDAGIAGITFGAANSIKYDLKSVGLSFNPINLYFTTSKGENQDLLQTLDKYLLEWKNEENSFLKITENKWIYGAVGAVPFIPNWIIEILIVIGIILIISFVFNMILKSRVHNATKKILERDKVLEMSEKKYHSIFNDFNDLFYQTDMNGIITNISPSCFEISGYKPEELIGRNVLEVYDNPEQRNYLIEKLKKEGKVTNFEIDLKNKKGEILNTSVSSVLIKDDQGIPKYIQGTIRDMTENKKTEDRIRSKNEELEEVNKLMIGRELKMVELKKEVEELRSSKKE